MIMMTDNLYHMLKTLHHVIDHTTFSDCIVMLMMMSRASYLESN